MYIAPGSRVDAEGRSEGVAACRTDDLPTDGEVNRFPEQEDFLSWDPALLSGLIVSSSYSSPSVSGCKSSPSVSGSMSPQNAHGQCTVEPKHGSQSMPRTLSPLGFRVSADNSIKCLGVGLGEASPVLNGGQGKDGVSTGLFSFRSGMDCQGPAAHIESVDQASVIADFPPKAIHERRHEVLPSEEMSSGYACQNPKGSRGCVSMPVGGLGTEGVKISKNIIPATVQVSPLLDRYEPRTGVSVEGPGFRGQGDWASAIPLLGPTPKGVPVPLEGKRFSPNFGSPELASQPGEPVPEASFAKVDGRLCSEAEEAVHTSKCSVGVRYLALPSGTLEGGSLGTSSALEGDHVKQPVEGSSTVRTAAVTSLLPGAVIRHGSVLRTEPAYVFHKGEDNQVGVGSPLFPCVRLFSHLQGLCKTTR